LQSHQRMATDREPAGTVTMEHRWRDRGSLRALRCDRILVPVQLPRPFLFSQPQRALLRRLEQRATPRHRVGAEGQQCFAKELAVKLQTDALSVRLDNFPKAAVLDLLTDVVELEANRLGLKAHGVAVQ